MAVLETMAAIKGGLGAIQGIAGAIGMARQAKKEPQYEIPGQAKEAEALGRAMGAEGMAGAQRTQALQDIQQSALMGLRASQDRRGGLMAAQNVQAQMGRQTLSLAAQDAAMRQQNQRFAYSALMAGAQYADKAFSNRYQSWLNKYQQSRALLGAGLQNITGAVDTYASGKMYENYLSGKSGTGGSETASPSELKKLLGI